MKNQNWREKEIAYVYRRLIKIKINFCIELHVGWLHENLNTACIHIDAIRVIYIWMSFNENSVRIYMFNINS